MTVSLFTASSDDVTDKLNDKDHGQRQHHQVRIRTIPSSSTLRVGAWLLGLALVVGLDSLLARTSPIMPGKGWRTVAPPLYQPHKKTWNAS